MRSMQLLIYRADEQLLEVRARDFKTHWMTAVAVLDDDTYLGAENSYNLFTLRKNADAASDEDRNRLEVSRCAIRSHPCCASFGKERCLWQVDMGGAALELCASPIALPVTCLVYAPHPWASPSRFKAVVLALCQSYAQLVQHCQSGDDVHSFHHCHGPF